MATSGRRGGSERVLESRHLVGLFLGVVLLCAVFFTLGYVMGKTQYGLPGSSADTSAPDQGDAAPVHSRAAARSADAGSPANSNTSGDNAPVNREWDFYASDKKQDKLDPPSVDPSVSNSAPASQADHPEPDRRPNVALGTSKNVSVETDRRGKMPWIPKGAIVLQLAALTREGDALAMADALQQKGFPSFVVTPTSDTLYRVQVGPYKNTTAAEKAKQSLDREGFKVIVRR